MVRLCFGLLLLAMVLCPTLVVAQSVTVTVPGTSDIFLAGQPSGTCFPFGNFDCAPDQSPTNVGLPLVPGSALQFTVTGGACNDAGIPATCSSTPDGGTSFQPDPLTTGPLLGLSGITTVFDAMVGVFLGDGPPNPSGTPGNLSFIPPGGTSFQTLAPSLQQVFFIGDGLTGTGTGQRQNFIVPTGATRLFLGSMDGGGQNRNNAGSFSVQIVSTPVYSCSGFAPPFDIPISLHKDRAIPVKMQLFNGGTLISDLNIAGAAPVVNVAFSAGSGGATDVTSELLPLGQSNTGNQLRFDTTTNQWIYNLGTVPFTTSGTYTVTAVSGDSSYQISPTCTGQFVRQ